MKNEEKKKTKNNEEDGERRYFKVAEGCYIVSTAGTSRSGTEWADELVETFGKKKI